MSLIHNLVLCVADTYFEISCQGCLWSFLINMPWMNNQTCSVCVRHTCLEQVRLNDDAAVTYLGGVAVATVAGRTGVTGCASGVRCISAMGRGISAMGRGGRHCLKCRVERSLKNGAHGGHALSRGSRRVALLRWCLEGRDE